MAQHSQYLESKVLTAPSHRLHLMLIEGAIRCGRQAETELDAGNRAGAVGPLSRVVDIVGELLAGVRQNKGELNDKLAAVYWFIFCRASEAAMYLDTVALADVLRLLEIERETWQKVCDKLGASNSSTGPAAFSRVFGAEPSPNSMTSLSLEA